MSPPPAGAGSAAAAGRPAARRASRGPGTAPPRRARRRSGPARAAPCGSAPRTAPRQRGPRSTSASSSGLERTLSSRNRSKNSRRLPTAESRKTLGWPSSPVPASRSARCSTRRENSSAKAASASRHRLLEPRRPPAARAPARRPRARGPRGNPAVRPADGKSHEDAAEEADERRRGVGVVIQGAEPVPGRFPQLAVVVVDRRDDVVEVGAVARHPPGELVDASLLDEPDARLGERQGERAPEGLDLAADGGDGAEGGVGDVEQLLAGREERAVGVERRGGGGLLLGGERLLGDAEPGSGTGRGRRPSWREVVRLGRPRRPARRPGRGRPRDRRAETRGRCGRGAWSSESSGNGYGAQPLGVASVSMDLLSKAAGSSVRSTGRRGGQAAAGPRVGPACAPEQ